MMAENKELTGYPSIDKPWLKFYKDNADDEANNIPENMTVWDFIEDNLKKHFDIPAFEYFGRRFSRKEFIDNVYLWARAFRNMGVKENEIVAYYGPFMPDVCFMAFGLNVIGACPYFLKLAISPEALATETQECRFAIVFDQMWDKVCGEFSKDKYERIIIAKITDAMPSPKKQIISGLIGIKSKTKVPKGEKYISVKKAKKLGGTYMNDVKVPFVAERNAFITSSSGTTVGGIVKGVVATNESVIAQVLSTIKSDTPYGPGDRTLNHFPPTASTSLNSLCFVGLCCGATIIIDPRVSENDFYNQLTRLKPSMCINTGSLWETFFNRVSNEMDQGKKFDFSYARGWMIGGEGTSVRKMKQWNKIVQKCGGNGLFGGYGLSETFSGICIDRTEQRCDYTKKIVGIGVPQAGMTVGIFDENNSELSYNQRGELRVKTKAAMKEYYKKPELTTKTKSNGWIRTGDIAEIDEKGFVYVWGRMSDHMTSSTGDNLYLFDLSERITEFDCIDDAIVLPWKGDYSSKRVTVHLVWSCALNFEEKKSKLQQINESLKDLLPSDIIVEGYAEYDNMLPYSPTTLKKDRNMMASHDENLIRL